MKSKFAKTYSGNLFYELPLKHHTPLISIQRLTTKPLINPISPAVSCLTGVNIGKA